MWKTNRQSDPESKALNGLELKHGKVYEAVEGNSTRIVTPIISFLICRMVDAITHPAI